MIHQQREWWEKTETRVARMLESIDTLAGVAHVHERGMSDLERGRS